MSTLHEVIEVSEVCTNCGHKNHYTYNHTVPAYDECEQCEEEIVLCSMCKSDRCRDCARGSQFIFKG